MPILERIMQPLIKASEARGRAEGEALGEARGRGEAEAHALATATEKFER